MSLKFCIAIISASAIYAAPTASSSECKFETPDTSSTIDITGFASLPKQLPKPHGKYGVGVVYGNMTDRSRTAIIGNYSEPRVLQLTTFYPTDEPPKATDEPKYYSDEKWKKVVKNSHLAENTSNPNVSHWAVHKTEATNNKKMPVLLFSHGLWTPVEEYTALCQEIASTGRIVIQITHSGYSFSTTLSDDYERETSCLFKAIPTCDFPPDSKEMADCIEAKCPGAYKNNIYPTFVDDVRYVLNNLKDLPASPLTAKMDFTNIGVSGHSIGGATATNISMSGDYKNVRFGLNLDGDSKTFGTHFDNLEKMVFKHFVSEMNSKLFVSEIPAKYQVVIPDSTHTDFQSDNIYTTKFDVFSDIHCKVMDFIENNWK